MKHLKHLNEGTKYSILAKKALINLTELSKFITYAKKTYGKKWWGELVGYSDEEIIANIKETSKSIN